MRQNISMFVQFALAVAIGSLVWMNPGEVNGTGERTSAIAVMSLVVGVGGSYFLTKLYVLVRYGREAARSFKWFGN